MFVATILSSTSALIPTPGPMSGAYCDTSTQLASSTVVMKEFKEPRLEALLAELAKTRLDLECSRMTGEDLRSLMTGDDDEQVDVATSPALYEGIEEVN